MVYITNFFGIIYATIGITSVKILRKYTDSSVNYGKIGFITLTPGCSCLTGKYHARLKVLATEKHSSLFCVRITDRNLHLPGVDLIKLFGSIFTYSFCKLHHFRVKIKRSILHKILSKYSQKSFMRLPPVQLLLIKRFFCEN